MKDLTPYLVVAMIVIAFFQGRASVLDNVADPHRVPRQVEATPTPTVTPTKAPTPTPTKPPVIATPTPQAPVVAGSDAKAYLYQVFGDQAEVAHGVAMAESGFNCKAHSPTNDAGILQVNLTYHTPKFAGRNPYDCFANIDVAYQIYLASGWSAWTTWRNGAYLRFL